MKEITIYVADDGRQFDNSLDCEWYEIITKFPAIRELKFYDYCCEPIVTNYDDWRKFDDAMAYHEIIEIPTEDALKALFSKEVKDFCDVPCAMKEYINTPGTWKWRIGANNDDCDDSQSHEEYVELYGFHNIDKQAKVVSVNPMTAVIDGNEAVKARWESCAGPTYNPNAKILTSKEMKEWWSNRETILASYKHTTTLNREDAEELLEYFDDNDILHIAKANGAWVEITYYADESDAKEIANFIHWMNSDERYYEMTGCAWDV